MVDEKLENSTHADAKPGKQIHWLKFLITIIGLLVISCGLAYIRQNLLSDLTFHSIGLRGWLILLCLESHLLLI